MREVVVKKLTRIEYFSHALSVYHMYLRTDLKSGIQDIVGILEHRLYSTVDVLIGPARPDGICKLSVLIGICFL